MGDRGGASTSFRLNLLDMGVDGGEEDGEMTVKTVRGREEEEEEEEAKEE